MVGTFADVMVADAIVKGVPGFDLALAKDALMKDVSPAAVEEPPVEQVGVTRWRRVELMKGPAQTWWGPRPGA